MAPGVETAEVAKNFFWKRSSLQNFVRQKPAVREVRELLELVKGVAGEASECVARAVLREAMLSGVTGLTELAQGKGRSAEWASGVLALMDAWLGKHRKELGKGYEAKRRVVGKKLRMEVLAPRGALYRALHVELWKCWFYRGEIELTDEYKELAGWMRRNMPVEYKVVLGLPRLSLASWAEWDEVLWVLVKEGSPGLLEELRKGSERSEAGVCKPKRRTLYWKDFRAQARNHVKAVAARAFGGN